MFGPPVCHLCGHPIEQFEKLEQFDGRASDGISAVPFEEDALLYWEGGSPILSIHRSCGIEDNAERAEAAYFASYGA